MATYSNSDTLEIRNWCNQFNHYMHIFLEHEEIAFNAVKDGYYIDDFIIIILMDMFRESLEFALEDDGITLFSLNNNFYNSNLASNLYFRTKQLDYIVNNYSIYRKNKKKKTSTYQRFVSTNRRYRKEWFKYLFMTYFVPHAQTLINKT
jgi:hypothetical protein